MGRSEARLRPAQATALFVATNGVGMGHLTRVMAIARRLPDNVRPVILTWSQALRLARREGFFVEYLPSHQYLRSEVRPWNALFLRRLHELIDAYAPGVILYDGVQPHTAFGELTHAHPAIHRVWCRRGMWRPGQATSNIQGASLFDSVLEPGEVAEAADVGATVAERARVHRVAPILFPDDDDLLSRNDARSHLGLSGDRPATLVQLGARAAVCDEVVQCLLREGSTDVVVARSPLETSSSSLPEACRQVDVYPIGRCYRAFDYAVAAPGYNAFHELLAFDIPTLFIPNPNAVVDNQPARAHYAVEQELAGCFDVSTMQPAQLDSALRTLLQGPRPRGLAAIARSLKNSNGATEAASFVGRQLESASGS